jgi:O-antigen biosynthesis protein
VKPPRVRVVVVDFNGGPLTLECLEHLVAMQHPADALDIVLVDNGSEHPVTAQVRRDLPSVRVVRSAVNLGFAGGCNLGMGDLSDVDFVALVNNDATVSPTWLKPLIETLTTEATVGAASPKILLARAYRELTIHSATVRPGRGDHRDLGVRITGVRIDGADAWRDTRFAAGTWGPELDARGRELRWTAADAVVLLPERVEGRAGTCELRLDASEAVPVTFGSGGHEVTVTVGPEPAWHTVPCAGDAFDVVNNVGTHLVADGYAADRGWLERDDGQYERNEDVFAWCGAAVLLRGDYLRDIGTFDERLFLYSEDVELSWRGLQRGWRHRYVPASVVRHVHSATSARATRAATFKERNRLLVLLRHGSPGLIARALVRYLLVTLSYTRRDVVAPIRAGAPIRPAQVRSRLLALAGFLRLAPAMVTSRRADKRRRSIAVRASGEPAAVRRAPAAPR